MAVVKNEPLSNWDTRVQLLRGSAIFSDLNDEECLLLVKLLVEVQVLQGETLLQEGETAKRIFWLISGSVHVIVRNEIVARIDTIDCLGEMSCLSGQPVSATVVAIDDCKLLAVDKASFFDVISSVPKVWQSLFLQSSHRISMTNKRLSDFLVHVPQGLLKLDRAAKVTQQYSKKCLDYFDQPGLLGKSFPDLIKIKESNELEAWMDLYASVISCNESTFQEHSTQLTKECTLLNDGVERILTFSYYPSVNLEGVIDGVDVGIQDVTEVRNLRNQLVDKLSSRETAILHLVAEGLASKEIARMLVISPHTVNDHLKAIYRKLGVHTKTQAIRKAFAHSGHEK